MRETVAGAGRDRCRPFNKESPFFPNFSPPRPPAPPGAKKWGRPPPGKKKRHNPPLPPRCGGERKNFVRRATNECGKVLLLHQGADAIEFYFVCGPSHITSHRKSQCTVTGLFSS